MNTIYAQVVTAVGPRPRVVDVAHRAGIQSPLQPVCALTLGTEDVTPLDMTDRVRHARRSRASATGPQSITSVRIGRTARRWRLRGTRGEQVFDRNDVDLDHRTRSRAW